MSSLTEESRVLKSGSNQFKLLEFNVGNMKQGVNLIKVKKIIEFRPEQLTRMLNVPSSVFGALEVDGEVISILDLRTIYGIGNYEGTDRRVILITEFNKKRHGFVVDGINVVHRLSWSDLNPVDKICPSDSIIAVVTVAGSDITLVDFETILAKIFPKSLKMPPEENQATVADDTIGRRKKAKLICADDSNVIRKKLKFIFQKYHFENVTVCVDGLDAFEKVSSENSKGSLNPPYTFMVTDIEMPQMDGLTLCKKIKDNHPGLPVLVLSSLVSEQFILKCKEVNADAALSKDNMDDLVKIIDQMLLDNEKKKLPA